MPHEMSWTSYQSGQDLNLRSLYSSHSTQVFPLHFCQTHWPVHLNIPILYSIGRPTCKMVLNLVSMHTTWKCPPYTADASLWISLDSAVFKVSMLQTEHLANHGLISCRQNWFFSTSWPVLVPNQPPTQWVLGTLSLSVKQLGHKA